MRRASGRPLVVPPGLPRWAAAGAAVAQAAGEEQLPPGNVTRTCGADMAASVARAKMVLGALEGPARERFKSGLCKYFAKGGGTPKTPKKCKIIHDSALWVQPLPFPPATTIPPKRHCMLQKLIYLFFFEPQPRHNGHQKESPRASGVLVL